MLKRLSTIQRTSRSDGSLTSMLASLCLMVRIASGAPQDNNPDVKDLTQLPLEDLLQIEVTTVAKKPQPLAQVAAAVFVVTPEDIRRSGATSLPEALRLVPGLHVARINASQWAVSSRGFNGRFADDMLVLIDDRPVYSPLFAGVFWEAQDTPLEDIERIEVTRGPGGSLWGANTTNGTIRIITKQSSETQGGLLSVGGGSPERSFGTFRYGGGLGDASYRLYGKGFDRDALSASGADAWRQGQVGFRTDWAMTARDVLTLSGDYYRGDAGQATTLATPGGLTDLAETARLSGGNLGLRWARQLTTHSTMALNIFYDHTNRQELSFGVQRNTFVLDFQHRFPLRQNQDVVWGLGYTSTSDQTRRQAPISFTPADRQLQTGSAFIQDEIRFLDDVLRLTLGAKYLHHTYAGHRFLPNAKLLWAPTSTHSFWSAVTRAIRLPSRFHRDGSQTIGSSDGDLIRMVGDPGFRTETLWSYELGARSRLSQRLTADVALFYNSYQHSEAESEVTETLVQLNNDHATTSYGAELAVDWQVSDAWRLRSTYTHLNIQHHLGPGTEADNVGTDPAQQVSVRSLLDLGDNVEFDAGFRWIDRLTGLGVPAYQALDLRLAWHPLRNVEIALIGQNLLSSGHVEFAPDTLRPVPIEVPRGGFVKLSWRF